MKKLNKKTVIIGIVIILVILLAIVLIVNILGNKKPEETPETDLGDRLELTGEIDMLDTTNSKIDEKGMKVNTSEKIAEGIEFEGMPISDIKIEATSDLSLFHAKVTNNSEEVMESSKVYLVFYNKDGNEIYRVRAFCPRIEPGTTEYIIASSQKDIATAYEVTVIAE